jgi:hypothetical protein
MNEIKPTAKGRFVITHGAPDGFMSENPMVTEGKEIFMKYDRITVYTKDNQHIMSFHWVGHELFTQVLNYQSSTRDLTFDLSPICGYVKVDITCLT